MKKNIVTFILTIFLVSFFFSQVSFAIECWFNGNIASSLDGCLDDTNLVDASGPTLIEGNVKYQIISWTNALASFFWLLAVWAIVYGGLLMTLAGWEDEKVKKGKDVVKWSLLWFLWIVVAGALVRVVIELMFSFTA